MGVGGDIDEEASAGDVVDYYDIVEAIHYRHTKARRDGKFDKLVELRGYSRRLKKTRNDRIAAFDELLKDAIEGMGAPLEKDIGVGALRAGARMAAKLDGLELDKISDMYHLVGEAMFKNAPESYQNWIRSRSKNNNRDFIGKERARDYCARIAYSLAGFILQEEYKFLQEEYRLLENKQRYASGPLTEASPMHEDPWRGRLEALDQTLTALHDLGFTYEQLDPNRVRWDAKSGFIDISTPHRDLIIAQARSATTIHAVSPSWDHERDKAEGEAYFDAQIQALRGGAEIKRVFLYDLEDSDLKERVSKTPKQAELIERRGRDAAITRAEYQERLVKEAVAKRGLGGKWGKLTTWVTHEGAVRTAAMSDAPALPIDIEDYNVPSVAVYNHEAEDQSAAVIDRRKSDRYLLSATASDIAQLYKLFLTAESRGQEEKVTAP
jgi:hypothetical protein